MDEWIMRLGLVVILSILVYFVWSWWSMSQTKVEKMDVSGPPPAAPPSDPVPQGYGITMYGTDTCPWCVKQKEYFDTKDIKYTYIDCMNTKCPNFVTGYPTVVRNGQVIHGFSEL